MIHPILKSTSDEKSYEKHPEVCLNKEHLLDLTGAEAKPLPSFRKRHIFR